MKLSHKLSLIQEEKNKLHRFIAAVYPQQFSITEDVEFSELTGALTDLIGFPANA